MMKNKIASLVLLSLSLGFNGNSQTNLVGKVTIPPGGVTNGQIAFPDIFVSQAKGNDANPGKLELPVYNLFVAQTLAASQGVNVHVLDGVFTNDATGNEVLLGTNGVQWYFEPGCVFPTNGGIIFSTVNCSNLIILGHAIFNRDIVYIEKGPSRVYVEADDINTTNAPTRNILNDATVWNTNGLYAEFHSRSNFMGAIDIDQTGPDPTVEQARVKIWARDIYFSPTAIISRSTNTYFEFFPQGTISGSTWTKDCGYIIHGGLFTKPVLLTAGTIQFDGTIITNGASLPPSVRWFGTAWVTNSYQIKPYGTNGTMKVQGNLAVTGSLFFQNTNPPPKNTNLVTWIVWTNLATGEAFAGEAFAFPAAKYP